MTAIIQRSTGLDTISSTDVSRQYSKVSAIIKSSVKPLEITKNGKTDFVAMNRDTFMGLIEMIEEYEDRLMVAQYESNRPNMNFVPVDEVFKDVGLGEYEGMSPEELLAQ